MVDIVGIHRTKTVLQDFDMIYSGDILIVYKNMSHMTFS